jgi:hypothetical protein
VDVKNNRPRGVTNVSAKGIIVKDTDPHIVRAVRDCVNCCIVTISYCQRVSLIYTHYQLLSVTVRYISGYLLLLANVRFSHLLPATMSYCQLIRATNNVSLSIKYPFSESSLLACVNVADS